MATRFPRVPATAPPADDALVTTIVARLAALPATEGTYPRLLDVMAPGDPTIEEIAAVIVTDRALSVRLLQMVNSAFFGLPFKVALLPQAAAYVGLTSLRALTLLATVLAAAESCATVPGFSPARLQRHSLLCARLARTLVADRRHRDDAFTGGLLHDLGMAALAVGLNQHYSMALLRAERTGEPLIEIETRLLSTNHIVVGAHLACVWGLPPGVIAAIGAHHTPGPAARTGAVSARATSRPAHLQPVTVVDAVRLAQEAADRLESGDRQFEGMGLTRNQIDLIDEEFCLTEIIPARRQTLLAI